MWRQVSLTCAASNWGRTLLFLSGCSQVRGEDVGSLERLCRLITHQLPQFHGAPCFSGARIHPLSLCLHPPPPHNCLHLFISCYFSFAGSQRRLFCTYLPSGDESWGIPAHRSASRWWRCGRRSHAPDEPVSASSCITLIISNRLHVPYEARRWVPTPPTHFQCVPQFSHLPRLYDWCRSERRLASPLLLIPHFLPTEPEVDGLICLAACQVASAEAGGGQRVDTQDESFHRFIDLLFDSSLSHQRDAADTNNNNNNEPDLFSSQPQTVKKWSADILVFIKSQQHVWLPVCGSKLIGS